MNKNDAKKWVKSWANAERALKIIKKRELSNYNYSKSQKIIDQMLQWAHEHKIPRFQSGLVNQQKYFIKLLKT